MHHNTICSVCLRLEILVLCMFPYHIPMPPTRAKKHACRNAPLSKSENPDEVIVIDEDWFIPSPSTTQPGKRGKREDITEVAEISSDKVLHKQMKQKVSKLEARVNGHAFCQGCIRKLFKPIAKEHQHQHPYYRPNWLPRDIQEMLYHPGIYPKELSEMLKQIYVATGRPALSCPACHGQVRHRPVQVFGLKSIICTVAVAQHDIIPRKTATSHRNDIESTPNEPWDNLFLPICKQD